MSVFKTHQTASFSLVDSAGNEAKILPPTTITPYSLNVPAEIKDNSILKHTTGGATEFKLSVLEQGAANTSKSTTDYLGFASDVYTHISSTGTGLALTGSSKTTFTISGGAALLTANVDGIDFEVPLKPPTYADATARDAAISSPSAGMLCYNTALTALQVYTTAWETITSV
jgi:hypothetical protein